MICSCGLRVLQNGTRGVNLPPPPDPALISIKA
jgi:hypothetical protein